MKGILSKLLLTGAVSLCGFAAYAVEVDAGETPGAGDPNAGKIQIGTIENITVEEYVEILNGLDGFIFVGVGEDRDVSRTLGREPENGNEQSVYQGLTWTSLNPQIVSVDENGVITGQDYGESIIQGIGKSDDGVDNDDIDIAYVVFVCPKVTVMSPEGAVYSYHKIFDQQTRVQFTHSAGYAINAVTRDGKDITEDEAFDKKTGWYISTDPIKEDACFCVTLEKTDAASENVVKDSTLKVLVNEGKSVTIVGPDDYINGEITITDLWGGVTKDASTGNSGSRKLAIGDDGAIKYDGIYELAIGDRTFKIIIYKN